MTDDVTLLEKFKVMGMTPIYLRAIMSIMGGSTAAAAPPPFRLSDPDLSGNHPLVAP